MSNPLMRGMNGYSQTNYQTPSLGGFGYQGYSAGGVSQIGGGQQTAHGASSLQINYNPMDYSGIHQSQ